MITKNKELEALPIWQKFKEEYNLTPIQIDQFARYLFLLQEYNELFNLTTITDPRAIISSHFQDSLALSKFVDFKTITMIADVGSGAGFPGIPLKIAFPHLRVILIEVTHKKIDFLNTVIDQLGLQDIEVLRLDWRTVLRKTDMPIDLFVSRASLHTDELLRMFKPSCIYNTRKLVYWASKNWQLSPLEEQYLQKEEEYTVHHKLRRFIFFALNPQNERNHR